MPEKQNGDYYYVESETVNELMDDFAIYQDGGNFRLFDEATDEEAGYVAGAGWDVPAGRGYHVNGTQDLRWVEFDFCETVHRGIRRRVLMSDTVEEDNGDT